MKKPDRESQNILIFFVAVIVLSVGSLMLHIFVFTKIGDYGLSFVQVIAPPLAVLFVMLIRRDKGFNAEILNRFTTTKKELTYSAVVPFALALVYCAVALLLLAFGQPFSTWTSPSIPLALLFMLLGCVCEEIGWRVFLLPALHRKFSLLTASIIVGVFWGMWHLNFDDGPLGFLIYTLSTTLISVAMAWLSVKNGYRLWSVTAFHFFMNLFTRLFLFGRFSYLTFVIEACLFAVIVTMLFLCDKKTFLSKRGD